jgi:hypothetical protein
LIADTFKPRRWRHGLWLADALLPGELLARTEPAHYECAAL